MRKTKSENIDNSPLMLTVEQLQQKLNCGYKTAVQIGEDAKARVYVGRRVWYYVPKIQEYLLELAV